MNLRQDWSRHPQKEAVYCLAPWPPLSSLSYIAQDLLPMADTAYSGVRPFTSISRQGNAPQVSHTQANLIWTMPQVRFLTWSASSRQLKLTRILPLMIIWYYLEPMSKSQFHPSKWLSRFWTVTSGQAHFCFCISMPSTMPTMQYLLSDCEWRGSSVTQDSTIQLLWQRASCNGSMAEHLSA